MLDALRAIKEETVTLSFSGSMRPILIEAGTICSNPSYISSKSLLKRRKESNYVQAHFMFHKKK